MDKEDGMKGGIDETREKDGVKGEEVFRKEDRDWRMKWLEIRMEVDDVEYLWRKEDEGDEIRDSIK